MSVSWWNTNNEAEKKRAGCVAHRLLEYLDDVNTRSLETGYNSSRYDQHSAATREYFANVLV